MASIAQPYNAAQFSWQNSQIPMASGPYQYAYGQAGYGQETPDYVGSFRDRDAQQVRYGAPDVGQFAQPMVGRASPSRTGDYATHPNAGLPAVQPAIGRPSTATYAVDPVTGRVTSTGNNIYTNPYFGQTQQAGGAGIGRAATAQAPSRAQNRSSKPPGSQASRTPQAGTNITPWTPGAARDPQLPPQQQQPAQNPYSIGQSIETPMPPAAESQYWVNQYAEQNARDFPNGATVRPVTGPSWGSNAAYNPDFPGQYGQSAEAGAATDAWGNVDWQPQQQLQQQAGQEMMPYQNAGMTKSSGYVPQGQQPTYATKPAWKPGVGGTGVPVVGPGSQSQMIGPPLSGPRPQNYGMSISGMQEWAAPKPTPQMIGPPLSGGQPYASGGGGKPVGNVRPGGGQSVGLGKIDGYNPGAVQQSQGQDGMFGGPWQQPQQSQQYGGGALTQGSWMNDMLSGLPRSGTYRTQTSTRMPTQRSVSVRQQQFMY